MNVLLDTCALLALARGELPDRAAAALVRAPEANVSVVSPWEVAIKAAGGKLRLKQTPIQWFLGLAEYYHLREIPLDGRLIVALAQAHALTVLTSDANIPKYPGVTTLW
ncbi:MAG: hypothetical protein AUH28_21430 [Acidobacteria bacterium 13_1_40CM_56_16]|nr:MAG: hypothetical protein AUH28_21430 [Acidobacteria bacterium 13_1_40CM_56_16]